MKQSVDVAVIGAGIAGLVAAHRLQSRHGLEVAVLEAAPRAGGKVATAGLAGVPVERGPDAFLARGSILPRICADLGLTGALVAPAVGRAGIWSRGRIRALPAGMGVGVPSRPLALAGAGLLTPLGAARAALDLVLPTTPVSEATTVAELVTRRFGRMARERVVDPLVGGIYAGNTGRLGLADALPDLYAAATRGRSLIRALSNRPPATGSPFLSLPAGLQSLTDTLAAGVADLRLSTPVTGLARSGAGYQLDTAGGPLAARAVVLAVPAGSAASLVRNFDPGLAELLSRIRYAGVATAALAYPAAAVPPTGSSGFLVPPVEGRLVTAVTWYSEKWPQAASSSVRVVRCSVGRDGDDRYRRLEDRALIDAIRADLAAMAGLRAEPLAARLTRWDAALPQYEPGHGARVREIEARLTQHPGLLLAGAAYRGVGLTACAASGERAAEGAARLVGVAA